MPENSYEKGYQEAQTEQGNQIGQSARRSLSILPHQATQLQRTERSQRNKDTEPEVEAEYTKGQGGKVKTLSRFGKAHLSQEFVFGPDGDLIGVTVEKRLNRGFLGTAVKQLTSGDIPLPPEMSMRLSRNHEGKFEVTQRTGTPDLKKWEDEFAHHLRRNSPQPHEAPRSEYEELSTESAAPRQQTHKPT